jgi:hypothetical protein
VWGGAVAEAAATAVEATGMSVTEQGVGRKAVAMTAVAILASAIWAVAVLTAAIWAVAIFEDLRRVASKPGVALVAATAAEATTWVEAVLAVSTKGLGVTKEDVLT